MSANPIPQPVAYPRLRINGNEYEFRFTRTSQFLLESWGYDMGPGKPIPVMAWAAACAGFVDSRGVFSSAGFKKPTEFVDQIPLEDDPTPIYQAVEEALKKAAPKAKLELVKPSASDSESTDSQPAN
jgi:hypothetical protein